jgi:hypothetical protein
MRAIYPLLISVAAACGLVVIGVSVAPAAPVVASARQRANDRAAVRRAQLDLRAFDLPPGSRRIRRAPGGAGLPTEPPPREGGARTIYRHQFWLVPSSPHRLFRRLRHHPPSALRPVRRGEFESGFFNEEVGEKVEEDLRQWWGVGTPGVIGSAVTVTAARLGRARTAVRIDAVVLPVKARAPLEMVPASATQVLLKIEHVRLPYEGVPESGEFPPVPPSNEGEIRALAIRAPSRVAEIIRLVDGLRVLQPSLWGGYILRPEEPIGEPGAPLRATVNLLFESRSGRVLARASQPERADQLMKFAVRGRSMPLLERGTQVLRALIPERRRAVQTRPPNQPGPFFP